MVTISKKIVMIMPLTLLIFISIIAFQYSGQPIRAQEQNEPQSGTNSKIIGYSYMGAPINRYEIIPSSYNKTMLLTFSIHGYDDGWKKDGAALVQIANDVIKEFSGNPEELKETRLIVIPCVNPDGVNNGWSNDGFGRCNAQGIDINRDFDYFWKPSEETRYRTGKTPFSTPEARVLRALVMKEQPDIIIDFHGWLNCSYGDVVITDCFEKTFGSRRMKPDPNDNSYMAQFFTGWSSQYARSALVEYPNPGSYQKMLDLDYSQKTIDFITNICNQI
jgi:hypothetical protein